MTPVINDIPPGILLPAAELQQWSEIATTTISDGLGRGGAMHMAIKAVGAERSFVGQAMTVQQMAAGNAVMHYALEKAWPGCVMAVDGRGHTETAIWGGVSTFAAKQRGIAALVIDGCVRDVRMIRDSGVPVYARGVVANGPHDYVSGGINVPIQCGGVAVSPGDILVGDEDGVVVIRLDQLDGLYERCKAREVERQDFMRRAADGETYGIWSLPDPK